MNFFGRTKEKCDDCFNPGAKNSPLPEVEERTSLKKATDATNGRNGALFAAYQGGLTHLYGPKLDSASGGNLFQPHGCIYSMVRRVG